MAMTLTQIQREEIILLGRLAGHFYTLSKDGVGVLTAAVLRDAPGTVTLTLGETHLSVSEVAFSQFSEGLNRINEAVRQGQLKFDARGTPHLTGGLGPTALTLETVNEEILWDVYLSHQESVGLCAGLYAAAGVPWILAAVVAVLVALACPPDVVVAAALAMVGVGSVAFGIYVAAQDRGFGVHLTVYGPNGRIVVVTR